MGTYIQTHSGCRVDLLKPDIGEICIEDIAYSLARICRFGGHVNRFYSVADHSLHVEDLLENMTDDWDILFQGLMHDASEAYVIDLPKPLKDLVPEYKEIEDIVEAAVWEKFNISPKDPIVKKADLKACSTEAEQLMFRTFDWGWRRGIITDRRPLRVRTIDQAEHDFLDQFYYLKRHLQGRRAG